VGAVALVCPISQPRVLIFLAALGLSACQTADSGNSSVAFDSVSAPLPVTRTNEGTARADRIIGAPLLASTRGGQSTIIEGSGRFVGEPPTGR